MQQFQRVSRQIKHLPEPVRLRFPNLFEKQQVQLNKSQPPSGQFAFRAGLVIHQSQQQNIALIQNLVQEIVNETWAVIPFPANFHNPLAWGPTNYPNDGNLKDCYVVNSAAGQVSPEKYGGPQDLQGQPDVKMYSAGPGSPLVKVQDPSMVFSGVECFVSINLYSYQTSPNTGGVACALNLVLLTGRDVGRFDGRISAEEAFADVPADAFAAAMPPPVQGQFAPPAGGMQPQGQQSYPQQQAPVQGQPMQGQPMSPQMQLPPQPTLQPAPTPQMQPGGTPAPQMQPQMQPGGTPAPQMQPQQGQTYPQQGGVAPQQGQQTYPQHGQQPPQDPNQGGQG